MSDLIKDPVSYARDVVAKDPMATYLGIETDEVNAGYARCSVTIKPEFLNAVERAHGAIIYAVLDQALAVAANSTGNVAVSLSVNINYISSAIDGEKIFAEAMPVSTGKKVSFWKLEVRGTGDKIIATGTGVAYHK
ncbi:MAG TPA: PaaI family thioesterase [Spirochaetota bacterium]|nr:PaaI family thioesterase [Spirochaetota bacterium]HPF04645.1 PaaI family thioesterase [Spirochaetota bacterium]HPJ42054.1 PaaI family thioesterase [Spirochaetota bacterium]HPR36154.1 PaaI family thioesterase [Spirochaetota bacterium]HRX46167.1 PaaI family thioesterase [Spirochaetota bacterium]